MPGRKGIHSLSHSKRKSLKREHVEPWTPGRDRRREEFEQALRDWAVEERRLIQERRAS